MPHSAPSRRMRSPTSGSSSRAAPTTPSRRIRYGSISAENREPDGTSCASRFTRRASWRSGRPSLRASAVRAGQRSSGAPLRTEGRAARARGAPLDFGPMTTIKPAVELGVRVAVARRTEELFRSSGALREGHFQLKSGRHGDAYVEKFAVLSDPAATSELCGFWAGAFGRDDDGGARVDLVARPTTGGIILAFETGRQLGVRAIFAEEVHDADGSTRPEFRRGFRIEPGERVLLVDDILTTGGPLLAMLPGAEAMGGEVV